MKALLYEMRSLMTGNDKEADHYIADAILVAALRFISEHSRYKKEVEELIEVYNTLDKWYS